VLIHEATVVGRVLLARERVELGADAVELLGDLAGRTGGRSLNIMCSMKWDMPASAGDSSRLPTANQMPRVIERTESMGSEMTVMPLSSTVLR